MPLPDEGGGGGGEPICFGCRLEAERQRQILPGYRIIRCLGEGGMGRVHLALHEATGRLVAIKTIRPAVSASSASVARFLREANILAALAHPHIVAFEEMGEVPNSGDGMMLYFVMEYVAGSDGRRLVGERGPLPVDEALALFMPVLDALDHAHGKGFVHRDVKPANLLVSEKQGSKKERIAKLADFGLARVYHASKLSGLTVQGQVGGTFGFMPPEQITDFRHARPCSDQYAAAATLYYLLTAKCPHDLPAGVNQQLAMILSEPVVPIRQRFPDLPSPLARVIHRALRARPENRYPDVRAFRRALSALP